MRNATIPVLDQGVSEKGPVSIAKRSRLQETSGPENWLRVL